MLPFIYSNVHSIQVFEETQKFIKESGYEERISELGWAFHSLGDLIPHTPENFWSGHYFPWNESWEELQVSFVLCQFGLYKQAMVSLRSAYELGLLSVYWNLHDNGHETINKWIRAREDTPKGSYVKKILLKHTNFVIFQQNYDFETQLDEMGYLHDYVHTKGVKHSNSMGLFKANYQTFEVEGFKTWFVAYEDVVTILAMLHLVKYPLGTVITDWSAKFGIDTPMFGGIRPFEVERLEKLLGSDVFSGLRIVASQDKHVEEILAWFNSLPDMTGDEVEDQIVEFDQFLIEQGGIETWLKGEQRSIDLIRALGGDPSERQERIEKLEIWAKENGFEKSALDRYKANKDRNTDTPSEE